MELQHKLALAVTVATVIAALVTSWRAHWSQVSRQKHGKQQRNSIAVVVLGDLGRSPRMQNHVSALSESVGHNGVCVWFLGNGDTPCNDRVERDSRICIHRIPLRITSRSWVKYMRDCGAPGALCIAFLKVLEQTWGLAMALAMLPDLRVILVQNPPSIPTLPIAWAICRLRSAHFVVDWHNFGASLLRLNPRLRRLAVVYHALELTFGKLAELHFCVSEAMRSQLLGTPWNLKSERVATLYDKPLHYFRPLSASEKTTFLHTHFTKQFSAGKACELAAIDVSYANGERTKQQSHGPDWLTMEHLFTQEQVAVEHNQDRVPEYQLKSKRPALLVTGTSWTPDEDVQLLMEALKLYDKRANEPGTALPDVVMLITGKGPLKERWLAEFPDYHCWCHVQVYTAFLPFDAYWRVLASADLGISLHASSSGVDLPMKVVDMRGVGLPALALQFPALKELLDFGVTGDVFTSAATLAERLCWYLEHFPHTFCRLTLLRKRAENNRPTGWEAEWNRIVRPRICPWLLEA